MTSVSSTRRALQLTVGLTVSGICLWLALRTAPLSTFIEALDGADYRWVALALLAQFAAVITRSERWRLLVSRDVRRGDAFWALGVGYLFTNVLPFRLGEPARVAALASRSGRPVAQVAATAVLDHLLDVATILLILAAIWPLMSVPPEVARAGLIFGLLLLAGLAGVLTLARLGDRGERLLRAATDRVAPRFSNSLSARWSELVEGFSALTGDQAGPVLAGSALTWGASVSVYWFVLRAFEPSATLVEAAFMVVALSLAISVPSGPGFIGVFHWVGQQALVLPFGSKYDAASALAITVTAHLVYYLFTSLLGIGGLWHFGASLTRLRAGWLAKGESFDLKLGVESGEAGEG